MSDERKSSEGFLARWSRLKTEEPSPATPPAAAARADVAAESTEAPPLPDIEELTIESDFRGFLHPKVDDNVRRAALRKLFSDPHFNIPDPYEPYSRDFNIADPIPPEMLATLKQAEQLVFGEKKEEVKEEVASGEREKPADEPGKQDA